MDDDNINIAGLQMANCERGTFAQIYKWRVQYFKDDEDKEEDKDGDENEDEYAPKVGKIQYLENSKWLPMPI